tara:strand:- start:11 stop:2569 length:2559 start_codon:yes stop_codon:yes gene_type:complete
MEDDELPEGEYIELPGETDDVEDTPDGGAIITIGDDEDEPDGEGDFYANLAEDLPEHELSSLSTTLLDLISKDKEARKKRDDQYEEGLRRTGLGDDAPGGATFSGASKVVHPMLVEACVDFAARAMKEIFPSGGPARDNIVGEATQKKVEKAKRKTSLINWQLTTQCPEFRAELEQLMTQVPLGGAQYLKVSWDERRNRPQPLFVGIDEMYLPFAATNFYSAQRKTHVQYLTQLEYQQRVKSSMYRDVDLAPSGMEPEQSAAAQANDKIEGRDQTSYNEDGLRIVFETYVTIALDDDDEPLPYIVTVDKSSGKVLAVYRNWEEEDDSYEELQWFVEFPFIPWRGAYPIGLPHMIGGLSGAATGALRALLDAAHIQNSQTMLKLKGGTAGGQNIQLQPGQTEEIEGGLNVDDIRKLAMPLPYNPPSPVLFQLLGFLVEAGKGVVRTSLEDIADGNANAPVGTTLAKLEQGAVVYSAIHERLHDAMARMLRILDRLNGLYLDDEKLKKQAGEELATRNDFDGVLDVVPVSDPNIFSETQRFAQIQAVAQRAAALPQLYNARKVEERILETLKIPDGKDLLNPAPELSEQNAVNENVAASLGRPVTAFPEQDHLAHLETHIAYLLNPMFGSNPIFATAFIPVILNHIKEHLALWYAATVFDISTEGMGGQDLGDVMRAMDKKDTDAKRALDQMLAEAAKAALTQGQQLFQQVPQIISQAQKLLQSLQPPMPGQDPRIALEGQKLQIQQQASAQKLQLDTQKLQAQQASEAQRMQLEQAGMQQDAQLRQAEMQKDVQLEQFRQQAEDQRKQAELQARLAMNTDDNRTAMELAAAEIASGERVAVSTGTGINPNPNE